MTKKEIVLWVLKELYDSVEDKEQVWFMGDKFLVRNFPPYGFTGARGLRNAQQYAQDDFIDRKIGDDGYVYFRWNPEKWQRYLDKKKKILNEKINQSLSGYTT